MEFDSSRFITAVCVDIFNSIEFRDVFDNRDNSFEIVSFNEVNDFLAEEFSKSCITFFSKFRIFLEVFSHLDGEEMNQMLSSGILDWHLDDFLSVVNNISNSINN